MTGTTDKATVPAGANNLPDLAPTPRVHWPRIVDLAADLAAVHTAEYGPPTLRRVHYLLVSSAEAQDLGYRNTVTAYKKLSDRTARARDCGLFPDLSDTSRTMHPAAGATSGATLAADLAARFTLDRERHLQVRVVILAEKEGLVPILRSRFAWLPVTAVKGYVSLSHAATISDLHDADRGTVGLYIGDLDPSGLDIERALAARVPFPIHRIALTADQVDAYGLPAAPAKPGDSRTAGMHNARQVEVDALDAGVILDLIQTEVQDVAGVRLDADGRPDLPDVDDAERRTREQFADLSATLSGVGL